MSYARTQFQTVCVSFTKTSQVAGAPFRNSGELIRNFPSNFTLLPHVLTENYIYDGPEPTVWLRGESLAQISRVSICAEAGRTLCSLGPHRSSLLAALCPHLRVLFLFPHQSYKVCFSLVPCKDLCSNKKKNLRSFLILDILFTAQSTAQRIKFSKTKW